MPFAIREAPKLSPQQTEEMLNIISKNTIEYRIKEWIDNFKANLSTVQRGYGIASLTNKLPKIPAIIIGSGPTLDWNINQLYPYQNRACIIACDSASKALEKAGIKPHIILCTDSKSRVRDFFANMETEKYNFILDTFCHPSTVDVIKGRTYWYSTFPVESCPFTSALNQWHGYIGNLGTGGCVATTGWWLAARFLGCDPVVLVGLPEAFYDPAYMYSRMVEDTIKTEPYEAELLKDFDIHGMPCFTYPALQSFTAWFEDSFRHTPIININCSEGGIIKRNCLNMPLLECIKRYLTIDYEIDRMLFINESVTDFMIQHNRADTPNLDDYRAMMLIMLDGPSLSNLSLRVGLSQPETNERVMALREYGFIIEDNRTNIINPQNPADVQEQIVFTLQGFLAAGNVLVTKEEIATSILENKPLDIPKQAVKLLEKSLQNTEIVLKSDPPDLAIEPPNEIFEGTPTRDEVLTGIKIDQEC